MLTAKNIDEKLKYYHEEIEYLRKKGTEFAKSYPKLARRLELTSEGSTDPHVERLIESFAFLTARVQKDINQKFPEFTHQILGALYPYLTTPVPSMAIAKFTPDISKMKSPSGQVISKGTELAIKDVRGVNCRFQTTQNLHLWPITLESADIIDLEDYKIFIPGSEVSRGIKISLKSYGVPFNKLKLRHLDLFLAGDQGTTQKLYDAIYEFRQPIFLLEEGKKHITKLAKGKVESLGFDYDHGTIPFQGNAHPAYRTLMEYFIFPEKLQFVSIWGLEFSKEAYTCELIVPISNSFKKKVSKKNFVFGCTPVINLFKKTSDPLRLDHKSLHYRLVGDERNERTCEIHTINKVLAIDDKTSEVKEISPYFSFNHWESNREQSLYWAMQRETSMLGGHDTLLSFVDTAFDPKVLNVTTVYAEVNCTNRLMAEDIPMGAKLESLKALPTRSITLMTTPTKTMMPAEIDGAYWKFISHVNLNHLSLVEGGAGNLKKILSLYQTEINKKVIEGILDVQSCHITRRIGKDAWKGFVQGVEVTITLDEVKYGANSIMMFGTVLRRFFALYASINSFVELKIKIKGSDKVWKHFPPMSGQQHLL